jgi:hypothetical protein
MQGDTLLSSRHGLKNPWGALFALEDYWWLTGFLSSGSKISPAGWIPLW